MKPALIWVGLAALCLGPIVIAAGSPYLQYREPVYILAGFAGIVALALMLVQPLLAAGVLPLSPVRARQLHIWGGAGLVVATLLHVGGLWVTSPPDVINALTFTSPTPFSAWGVVAMWAIFAAALVAVLRRRLATRAWRLGHVTLVALAVVATLPHAWLIEGTMGTVSKALLLLAALAALLWAVRARRTLRLLRPRLRP
ncbi:MAG: ferric reductase-like transmembrane domain-containing protein [Pseudomonadota bacterium]